MEIGSGLMNFYWNPKSLLVYFISAALLTASVGCSYHPSYLQKSEKAQVSERWKVEKIDPSRLSPEEAAVYEKEGAPQYVRFFRQLAPDRKGVYEWIYLEPVRLVSFIDGKTVEYVVVDDNPSPLNEYQKEWLYWSSITAGTVVGLGLLYYFLIAKK